MLPSNDRIEFRIPSDLKQEIVCAAKVQNRSLSEFATSVLTEVARKVLAEHARFEHVQLSNRDRDRFLAVLDAEDPNPALRAAAQKHRQRLV